MKGRKTGCRQKGTPNKATAEAQINLHRHSRRPDVSRDTTHAGTLPPAIETMLWHYAYGKPTDIVDVTVGAREENLRELSTEELLQRVDRLREQLLEADAIGRSIPDGPDRSEHGRLFRNTDRYRSQLAQRAARACAGLSVNEPRHRGASRTRAEGDSSPNLTKTSPAFDELQRLVPTP